MLKDKLRIVKSHPVKIIYEENYYEKKKLIGQGTFGKVYSVINKKTQKQLALKEVVQDSKYKNRQLNIISQLEHPNIIEMKDYFFRLIDGECVLHILMEYMDTSLASLLKGQRKLKQPVPLHHRKLLTFQLFKGLYYLGINNVCHRDLKPPNILINCQTCELKICDFGSAKIIETKQNNVSYICSRYYRAPQLILNSSTYGCEIDMWSAGCILVELLTLEPLFPGDSSLEQLIEIIKILGTPKKKHIAKFSLENAQIHLPKVKGADLNKILARYKPEQNEIDLIKKILTYDTETRLTPYQAMMHPYFKDMMSCEQVHKLPDLINFQCLKTPSNKKEIGELESLHLQYQKQCMKEVENGSLTADSICKSSDL